MSFPSYIGSKEFLRIWYENLLGNILWYRLKIQKSNIPNDFIQDNVINAIWLTHYVTKTVTYQVKVNFPLQLVNGILCTFVYSSLRSTNKLTNALNGEGEEVNVCLSCNNKAFYMHTTPRLREYLQFYFSNHSFIFSLFQ